MQLKKAIRGVNLLLLLIICLQVSNLFFFFLPQYVRMILNEALFIFLPAYLYLRRARRSTTQTLAERVRWRWPGWKIAGLALLVGIGLYPLSAWSAERYLSLLGYTSFAVPADAVPTGALMGTLAIIAYAVMAPLCEEFLFRGVIQPVYETRGPKWGVIFVGFLFIAFHLSLLQGLSIIPLALALGFVFYRTRSLPASILTHFGANFLASLVITQTVFKTGIEKWIVSVPVLVGGLVFTSIALFLLVRLTRATSETSAESEPFTVEPAAANPGENPLPNPTARTTRAGWFSAAWPLLAAGLLYLPMIGIEFFFSRSPELVAGLNQTSTPLPIQAARWDAPLEWDYEIRTIGESAVGEGSCRLVLDGALAEVTCSSQVEAYKETHGNSTYSSSGGERIDRLQWQLADGRMTSGSSDLTLSDGTYTSRIDWNLTADSIEMLRHVEGEEDRIFPTPLSETPLAQNSSLLVAPHYTWPWQLAGIPFEQGTSGSVVRYNPYTWRNETQDSGPVAKSQMVTVVGKEEVTTPAGIFTAWKVTMGSDQTAWYDVNSSHTLVKFFNGIETWYLK